jgi:hypothetical protein
VEKFSEPEGIVGICEGVRATDKHVPAADTEHVLNSAEDVGGSIDGVA